MKNLNKMQMKIFTSPPQVSRQDEWRMEGHNKTDYMFLDFSKWPPDPPYTALYCNLVSSYDPS